MRTFVPQTLWQMQYNTFNNAITVRCRVLPLVGRGQTSANSDTARTAIAHHHRQCSLRLLFSYIHLHSVCYPPYAFEDA